jgi:PAS domain S-box-containing protein
MRFQPVFRLYPHPTIIFDRRTLRVLEVNKAAERCYGWGRRRFLSMDITRLRAKDELPEQRRNVRRILSCGSAKGLRARHRTASGRAIDVEIDGHLIRYLGRPAAFCVVRDLTRQRRLERAAATSRLMACLVRAEEAERIRVARELHDGVNQLLAAAKMGMALGRRRRAQGLLDRAIGEIRRVVRALRPADLETLGLERAMSVCCRDTAAASGLDIRFSCRRLPPRREPGLDLALYRVLQEALSNVLGHAHASRVRVRLEGRGGWVRLEVEDDGRGARGARPGAGLAGVRERAALRGGRYSCGRSSEGGFALAVDLPVAEALR